MIDYILYIVVFSLVPMLCIGSFCIGYLFGLKSHNNGVFRSSKTQALNKAASIAIDEKTIVTSIHTSGMEKKYDKLGDVQTSSENITDSINKLKNLKR
jgi:hypothetical protein